MDEEEVDKKFSTFDKVIFILRYLFFGFLVWSYNSAIFTIFRRGAVGDVIGLAACVMFFVFKGSIDPLKMNHKEFGKYTDIMGILISLIFVLFCLAPLFGIGPYKLCIDVS